MSRRTWCWLLCIAVQAVGCDSSPSDAESDASGPVTSPLYAEVEDILTRSCAYTRCHSGALIGGALELKRGADYWVSLVDIPACEYERMKRVEPGDPENSWLMVKLTAPFRDRDDPNAGYIYFDPSEDWDPAVRACRDEAEDGTPLFGQRMPTTVPNMLPEDELEAIREWIAAGAPH